MMILSLILIGETRLDVYITLSILTYFISSTILPCIREVSNLKYIDVPLIILFIIVVGLRIAEVMGYKLPGGIT